jgi:hypothetical protein
MGSWESWHQIRNSNTLSWSTCSLSIWTEDSYTWNTNAWVSDTWTITQCNSNQYILNWVCVNKSTCTYWSLAERIRCLWEQTNQELNQNINWNTRECFDYGPIKNESPAKWYGIQTQQEDWTWWACMLDRCSWWCENFVPWGCTLTQNSCFSTKKSCVGKTYERWMTRAYLWYSFLKDDLSYWVCIPDNTTRWCDISNGKWQRIRINNERWECEIVSCNNGYQIQGNSCVVATVIPN